MDKVSFQNGFICGMATKGLVRSGQLYQPTVYNDEGIYTYFYIDFRQSLQDFSVGMFNESIIVHDSQQIAVSQVEQVSSTVYKVYANIANLLKGITILNKKTSRLRFATGERLPVFSVHMYISGITAYVDGGYMYDKTFFKGSVSSIVETLSDASLPENMIMDSYYDSTTYQSPVYSGVTEQPSVTLI